MQELPQLDSNQRMKESKSFALPLGYGALIALHFLSWRSATLNSPLYLLLEHFRCQPFISFRVGLDRSLAIPASLPMLFSMSQTCFGQGFAPCMSMWLPITYPCTAIQCVYLFHHRSTLFRKGIKLIGWYLSTKIYYNADSNYLSKHPTFMPMQAHKFFHLLPHSKSILQCICNILSCFPC